MRRIFPPAYESIGPWPEKQVASWVRGPTDIIMMFDISRHLCITRPCAAAAPSRSTGTTDSLGESGATDLRRDGDTNRPPLLNPNCQTNSQVRQFSITKVCANSACLLRAIRESVHDSDNPMVSWRRTSRG